MEERVAANRFKGLEELIIGEHQNFPNENILDNWNTEKTNVTIAMHNFEGSMDEKFGKALNEELVKQPCIKQLNQMHTKN
jgi:hypothetical protein